MKNMTDITLILDKSGSMEPLRGETISSVNKFINEQKAVPGEANLSIVLFDTAIKNIYAGERLSQARLITKEDYNPDGYTALYDAMGSTIDAAGKRLAELSESDRPNKVVVVTVTDGEENSSREYTSQRLGEMIKKQSETYKWQFVFIGANQDAILTARGLNIASANAMSASSGNQGCQGMYRATSSNLRSFRLDDAEDMAYSAAQKDEQEQLIKAGNK